MFIIKERYLEVPNFQNWTEGLYLVDAPCGTGKSYFVFHTLYPFAKENNKKLIVFSNRNALKRQQELQAEGTDIELITYQKLEYALTKGLQYANQLHMSKQAIYDQLTSSYGEGFPADAAQYAVDNMTGVDWNANALEKAKQYYYDMAMSKSAVYDQLTSSYGEQFTASQAQYAIDHLD